MLSAFEGRSGVGRVAESGRERGAVSPVVDCADELQLLLEQKVPAPDHVALPHGEAERLRLGSVLLGGGRIGASIRPRPARLG